MTRAYLSGLVLLSACNATGFSRDSTGTSGDSGGASPGIGLGPSPPLGEPPALGTQPSPGNSEGSNQTPPLVGSAGSGSAPVAPAPSRPCDTTSSNPSGYCWGSVVIGGGGFVSGIVSSTTEPNLVFARTDVGGAYRWDEAGGRWLPLNDWVSEDEVGLLGIESIAIDPNAPSHVYMLAGIDYFNGGKTAILRSSDYGASFSVQDVTSQFKAHGNGLGRQSGERLAVDPQQGNLLLVGTRRNGLFRSTDEGQNWSRVASLDVTATANGNGIAFVVFDPRSGTLEGATRGIYVGISRAGEPNLYVSSDAGQSWAPVEGQPTTYVPQRAALAEDGTLVVTYANGAGPSPSDVDPMDRGEIWKLAASGGAWTEITPLRGDLNRAFGGISIDASDPQRLLATTINTYQQQPWGYGDRLFLSTDGGTSWTDLIGSGRVQMDSDGAPWIEGQAIHWAGSVQIDPFDPERAWVTSGNGVFRTQNLSAAPSTWSFATHGLEETVPLDAVSIPGGPLVTALGDYDGFVHDDLEQSPARGRYNPAIGTTQSVAVAALAPARMARVGNELYVSSDGAASWSLRTRPSAATGGRLAFSADGASLLWSAGGEAYRSPDAGQSWAAVSGLATDAIPTADSVAPLRFYAYSARSGAFSVSADGGATFTPASTLATGGAPILRSVPGQEGQVWVALNGGGLSRSSDAGVSFARVASVSSCRAVGFGAAAPGQSFPAVYIWGAAGGGPRGLYRSDDQGDTWLRINDDAHEYGGPGNGEFVIGDANVYGRVFMSSAGRGLLRGEIAR